MIKVWRNKIFIFIVFLVLTFGSIGTVPAHAIAADPAPIAPSPAAYIKTSNTMADAFIYALPALGTYPAASVALSGDTTVTPAATPTGATGINVSTDTNFKGIFAADPATGVVTITNAHPAGVYIVTVKATGAGGSTSTTFTLTVNTGAACTGVSTLTGSKNMIALDNPAFVAIGDFNNDGKQDIAIANYAVFSGSVSIRLGDGAGSFSKATQVNTGKGSRSIGIGDFNNDGNQDLVVADYKADSVSIRMGNGSGGFSGTTSVAVTHEPISIAIGDFNNDGNQDFAVTNDKRKNVSIRLGDGSGGFSSVPNVAVGNVPVYIVIGDFNKDGNQDFLTSNFGLPGTVSVRLGNGTGAFSKAADVSVFGKYSSLAIGDFNNDGNQDFAATDVDGIDVSIRMGDGSGGFSSTTSAFAASTLDGFAIGDFNNDGNQDFVAANQGHSNVAIRLGNGLGGFSGTTTVSVGAYPYALAVGDFNSDGRQDVVTTTLFPPRIFVRMGVCNFTATFKANGGSGSMTPQASNVAANLTANTFTRSGYRFVGWNTAADGSGTAYPDGALYPFTADVTLYAQWTISLSVSINQASGQADPATVAPIHFTAVFSEAVTGFTGKNISFAGTTLTGTLTATVTEIAPNNGTTYDVAVTGMIPQGKVFVRIPAGGVTSLVHPAVTNQPSTSTDNNVGFDYVLVEFGSNGVKDGWVLESTRTSGAGGSLNDADTTISVGDDAANRQYRSVLDFSTSSLPDNAVIYSVTLRVIQSGITGTNPLTTHGLLKSEIRSGFFGTTTALQNADFQAASDSLACNFEPVPEILESLGASYRCAFFGSAFPNISLTGTTQFRLRFTLEDNNDASADLFSFYSGDFSNATQRPRLFIKYYIPPVP